MFLVQESQEFSLITGAYRLDDTKIVWRKLLFQAELLRLCDFLPSFLSIL